jgi:NAD(P)-dependent dehydrogenase (short-subunit alcohol dehydrogenase family)
MPHLRFAGSTVLVVGAAQGIGRATAEAFADEGAMLGLADISSDLHATLDQVLAERPGIEGMALTTDITDAAQCAQAADAVAERFGAIDVLAVVSGVMQQAAPVAELDADEWDRVMAVNAKGPFLMAKAVVPHMRSRGRGRIINVGSWWGHSGHAYFSAYCASKAAMRILTQALADEVAKDGITANALIPGNVNTSMHEDALQLEANERGITLEEIRALEWGKIPLSRPGEPEDIANAILYLASEEARYVTGASLDINGGSLYR